MQTLTKTDVTDMNELQGLITITWSPCGKRLKKPISINIPKTSTIGEKALLQFVIEAFSWKFPTLIQFSFDNDSMMNLIKHFYRHSIRSVSSLYQYVYGVYRFSEWACKNPDDIIADLVDDSGVASHRKINAFIDVIDAYLGDLTAQGLSPCTISNYIKAVKTFCKTNKIALSLPFTVKTRVKHPDRAPKPEELAKVIDIADLRGKVIVSMMALAGFREGTLAKLRYSHIREDYEANRIPIHIHVEAEITKGKYHAYDTFIGQEAVQYLRAYLELRKRGCKNIPHEQIVDNSPLIRNANTKHMQPISQNAIYKIIHDLFFQAGLIVKTEYKSKTHVKREKVRTRYRLRPHSIRKYFRTQLGFLNTIPVDYIEYMMGHTVSTYNDVKHNIEKLRGLYASSGLSIRPKTKQSKIEQLKLIIEAWGMNPNEILTRETLSMPHRTVVDPEQTQIEILNQTLKQAIVKELQSCTKTV
jgi:integrase